MIIMKELVILRKVNSILNIVIGLNIGIFVGYGICVFWDYKFLIQKKLNRK